MKTRDAVLLYQNTEADTKTEIVDLDLVNPISALEIEVESTNGSTSNKDNFISDILTKLEIVDGSDVLTSLNMAQLEALYFYHTGQTPCLFPSEWAGGIQRHQATLFFGKHLWDREYALNTPSFKNPQLKVTFNKAAIRAAGATGFASGDNIKLTVVAKVMEDVPSPGKYFMQKQINSFTSAASGDIRIELPTDYPYRMAMIRPWLQGSDVDEVISDIKMTCDTDKFIPFNRKVKQLDATTLAKFGPVKFKHDILRAHGETIRLLVNKEPQVQPLLAVGVNDILATSWQWSGQMYLNLFVANTGVDDSTARNITCVERGHALHATVPIPFGRLAYSEDWFNPKDYGKVELVLTQAAANAVCEVVLEQVRSY